MILQSIFHEIYMTWWPRFQRDSLEQLHTVDEGAKNKQAADETLAAIGAI